MNVFQSLVFVFLFYCVELDDSEVKETTLNEEHKGHEENLLPIKSDGDSDEFEIIDNVKLVNPSFDDFTARNGNFQISDATELDACFHNIDCVIVCDQAESGVYIYSLRKPETPIWFLNFKTTKQIPEHDRKYFNAISEAKLVYKDYVGVVTSGGGIALIELKTARIIKYYIVKGNLHSLDFTPDGAIIAVSSTENFIVALPGMNKKCDTSSESLAIKKYNFPFGHAVVHDLKSNKIWIGGNRTLQSFKYNYDAQDPRIIPFESFYIEDDQIHDITPIMNSDYFWFTTLNYVYLFNHKAGVVMRYYDIKDVKSISSCPNRISSRIGRALLRLEKNIDPSNIQNMYKQGGIKKWSNKKTIRKELTNELSREARSLAGENEILASLKTIYVVPKEEWWTDEIKILNSNKRLFFKEGAKIYKARYLQLNSFSYELFYPKTF